MERAEIAANGIQGKRLTYRRPSEGQARTKRLSRKAAKSRIYAKRWPNIG